MKSFYAVIALAVMSCAPKPVAVPDGFAAKPVATAVAEPVAEPFVAPTLYAHPYLVQPGDWLSKIAFAAYGDTTYWHRVYAWNRAKIGDNPDMLYPYVVLQLRKVSPYYGEQRYHRHIVQPGETLWSIADSEYGDPKAWVLIFSDNRGVIHGLGNIPVGQSLRIRYGSP